MSQFSRYASILIFILLTGCSQRFVDTGSTLKEAFFGFEDVNLSQEQIKNLPYASMYARVNGTHQILMVLAVTEQNPQTGNLQLKWVSADNAMITTENGRIVKTLNLPESNLVSLSASNQLTVPSANNSQPWNATYDWQPGYQFGHVANVTSQVTGQQMLTSPAWQKQTTQIRETVRFNDTESQMTSNYWIDQQGQVVKSAQWVIPDQLFIELEIIKPFAVK